MNNVTQHPACRPVPAVDCVDAIDCSVENIRDAASMLHTIARHTRQAITAAWLYHVAQIGQAQADDIDYTVDLWRSLAIDPLPGTHQAVIGHQVARIRQHAHHLAAVGDDANICPPSRAHVAGVVEQLLEAVEALRQASDAAWAACRTQPAPAA